MTFYLPKTPRDIDSNSDNEEIVFVENKFNTIFYDGKINAWSLPLGIGLAFLVWHLWVFSHLSILFCVIPIHELGHAVTAWMLGHFAIPIGAIVPTAGMTIGGRESHWWMYVLLFSALSYLTYNSYNKKVPFLLALSIIIAFLSVYLSIKLNPDQQNTLIAFGGIGGEFLLSTVLILSFYHPLFEKMRWDFFRYPFFIMGCFCFVEACTVWWNIKSRLSKIPYGSGISAEGAADSDGDMNKLVAAGWTEEYIISKYILLAKICCTIILIQYVYRLISSRKIES
jgi:hypothetical protein